MASIQGKDVVVELSTNNSTWFSLVCEISNSLPITRETNSLSTKCNAGTTTRSLGAYSWEVSAEAVAETAPSGTQVSYEQLLAWHIAGTTLYVRVSHNNGASFYHNGQCFITNLELTNEVNGVSQFSITLSGSGALTIAVPVPPFSPTDLSNLWAWYKADAGVTGTTTVTAWADQSGNGRNLTSVTGNEPALVSSVLNSYPAISSYNTALAQMKTAVDFPTTTGVTVYIVARQSSTSSAGYDDGYGTFAVAGYDNWYIVRDANLNKVGGAYKQLTLTTDNATENTFYSIRLRGNSTTQFLALNNGTEASGAAGSASYTAEKLWLFDDGSGFAKGAKQIVEIIIYTEDHNSTKRGQVETYLKNKYAHY